MPALCTTDETPSILPFNQLWGLLSAAGQMGSKHNGRHQRSPFSPRLLTVWSEQHNAAWKRSLSGLGNTLSSQLCIVVYVMTLCVPDKHLPMPRAPFDNIPLPYHSASVIAVL